MIVVATEAGAETEISLGLDRKASARRRISGAMVAQDTIAAPASVAAKKPSEAIRLPVCSALTTTITTISAPRAASTALAGGASMRKQSLDGVVHSYFDFRNKLAAQMRSGAAGKNPGARELVTHAAKQFGVSPDQAAEWVERFMRDLKNGLNKRSES